MLWATDSVGIGTVLFPPKEALDYLSTHPITYPAPRSGRKPSPKAPSIHQAPGINGCFHTWDSAVAAEISSTALIRAAGYKVEAMMAAFHGLDEYEQGETCEKNDDFWFKGGYMGISLHPFETGFKKSNRDLDPLVLERHTSWVKGRNYRSRDYCHAL